MSSGDGRITDFEVLAVDPQWDKQTLLNKNAIFFLKDILRPLQLTRDTLRLHVARFEAQGLDPWLKMGINRYWSPYQVQMKVFANYYRIHCAPRLSPPPDWDANVLLNQKEGVFLLEEVCCLIPFSAATLLSRIRRHPRAGKEMGITSTAGTGEHVVDLATFGPWLRVFWRKLERG